MAFLVVSRNCPKELLLLLLVVVSLFPTVTCLFDVPKFRFLEIACNRDVVAFLLLETLCIKVCLTVPS